MTLPVLLDQGVGAVADRYDAFILDLWGVVHNGEKLYPDTIACLAAMRAAGKKIWLLSNAPRSGEVVRERLRELGLQDGLYDGIVTSGDAAREFLRQTPPARDFYFLGNPAKDASVFEGLPLLPVEDMNQAGFLLVTGVYDFGDSIDMYRATLEAALARNLTMICANPDRIVHVGDMLVVCAGTFADIYEAAGGKVIWMGKPYKAVYDMIFDRLPKEARVAAIGDSLITDIAGANGCGIDSFLVMSGIHRDDFAGLDSPAALFDGTRPRPDWLLDRLHW